MTRLVLGMAGCGTKSTAVIADEHSHILTKGVAGPSDIDDLQRAVVLENIGGADAQEVWAGCSRLMSWVPVNSR